MNVTTRAWTHPQTGQVRRYVTNVVELAVDLAGGDLSGAKRSQADRAKVWIDDNGEVHVDDYALRDFHGFGSTELVARIKELRVPSTQPQPTTSDNEEAPATAAAASSYTEVRSSLYGKGRRYHDRPGATQYDDGSGRYAVQIWDES